MRSVPASILVEDLFVELFTAAELVRLLRSMRPTRDLAAYLPSEPASARAVATEAVALLERHGLLAEPLFEALREARPHRERDIGFVTHAYMHELWRARARLEASRPRESQGAPAEQRESGGHGSARPPRGTILWVDDDSPHDFALEAMLLDDEGWAVTFAQTCLQAVDLLSTTRYDVAIFDQMLPFAEARAFPSAYGAALLTHWVRSSPARGIPDDIVPAEYHELMRTVKPFEAVATIPIVVVSSYFDQHILALTRQASRRDLSLEVLHKPVDIDRLREALADALHRAATS